MLSERFVRGFPGGGRRATTLRLRAPIEWGSRDLRQAIYLIVPVFGDRMIFFIRLPPVTHLRARVCLIEERTCQRFTDRAKIVAVCITQTRIYPDGLYCPSRRPAHV